MQANLVAATIVAIGLVTGAVAFALVGAVLQVEDGGALVRLNRATVEVRELRRTLEAQDVEIEAAKRQIEELRKALADAREAANRAPAVVNSPTSLRGFDQIGEHSETKDMTEQMILADERFNKNISQPRNRIMREVLGNPRQTYGVNCQSVTNPSLRALLETRQVGPIKVTMIRPALDSLERIMKRLQEQEPDIHAAIGTAGALCARLIRGSSTGISNHSWGTAIDLKLKGRLDGFGDGSTQFGLLLIAELFNEEGWYWGATYSREDSMHFEVGVETLRKWAAEGLL
ncbi:M15 family metallopeptidase [uncultured Tateyamaria sp.]|uniref:M15 family metallopeptidase n=1 Tax=uncultured Tateyamaria sp. TaxID=455651 RepID=UPI002630DAC2|nr:M15 family metallopeptidase [uncultured Tateyamaria sp.]